MKTLCLLLICLLAAPIMAATTVEVTVAASADDAVDDGGAIYLTEAFTYFESGYQNGFRFLNLTIAADKVIDSCYILFTSHTSPQTGFNCNMVIRGESVADAATFSTHANYTGRTRTTAEVTWSEIEDWTDLNNYVYRSPELKTILSEIITASSGLSSEDVVFFIDDDGTSFDTRYAISYNQSATKAPKLHIVYSDAPAGGDTGGKRRKLIIGDVDERFPIYGQWESVQY